MKRSTADDYLNRIDVLLRAQQRRSDGSMSERMRVRRGTLPGDSTEKLRGVAVVLRTISGERRLVPPGLARWCEEVMAEAQNHPPAAHPPSFAVNVPHGIAVVAGLFLVLWLGFTGNMFWAPALLVWLVYAYRLIAGKILPYTRAKGSPMGGTMDARSYRIIKVILAVLFIAGAILLGATFGVGGAFIALLIGAVVILLRKFRRASPPTDTSEVNPASGSFMMPGDLLDVRGNPYGRRRDG